MNSLQETKIKLSWAQSLPDGWKLRRFKSVASIRYGLGQPPAELSSGVAIVRATDVDAGKIHTDSFLRIDPSDLPMDRTPYLKASEIIVVRSGAYTGDSAIIPAALEGSVAGYDMVVTVTQASPNFIAYGLLSKYVLDDQIHLLTLRAAQPHLNSEELGGVIFAIPSNRHEQERIAAYIDASCAAIDAAVAAKRKQLETLDTLRNQIIQKVITNGIAGQCELKNVNTEWLGNVPVHWNICRIKRVLSRLDYGISVSTNEEGKYPVLKMGHIGHGEITFGKFDYVDDVPDSLLLEKGDILYNRTNSPDQVGKAAIYRKSRANEITFASYLVRLRVNHRIDPEFLNYAINSEGFLSYARRLAIPSVQQSNLNSTRYARLWIPLPPMDEQREIVKHLTRVTGDIAKIKDVLDKQIDTLTAYRKSLIHECVTGQRRISEADVAGLAPKV